MSLVSTSSFDAPARPARGPRPGSLGWFLRHEVRLALRDWIRPGRELRAAVGATLFVAGLHFVGWWIALGLPDPNDLDPAARRTGEILIGAGLVAVFGMLVAQAMEAVTRSIYVRGDLELVLSSPASARTLFVVRMIASTITTLGLAGFLILPVADMLVATRGWSWATAHGMLVALAAAASAVAIVATRLLFAVFGPRRTRLAAQVVGATIGAATVIGTQVPFVLKFGSLSVFDRLRDPDVSNALPGPDSPFWAPVRAVHGDVGALAVLAAAAFLAFAAAVAIVSRDFAAMAIATAGADRPRRAPARARRFRVAGSPRAALRAKELRLIVRDPWLLSQSLTQVLYLLPPALLLWRNFGEAAGHRAMLVPVLVMAAAQLAGGFAWLTLSAEDAPDLVATAPVTAATAMRAKIEAVLIAVATVTAPLLVLLGLDDPGSAAAALGFGIAGVASNCLVQSLFRTEARRSQFRLRQRASKAATIAETAVSIAWAGAAGLAAVGSLVALVPSAIALAILGACALARRGAR